MPFPLEKYRLGTFFFFAKKDTRLLLHMYQVFIFLHDLFFLFLHFSLLMTLYLTKTPMIFKTKVISA